ncbi:hypothetical protein N3K63_01175 [Microbacterium sp. W1N]|uniref:hypothetical protein n=1 Tax=Microbacterium festucae TaxID=2977531 RepID=UPI0021BEC055|nr:hypothetical protein [Microbacterium festucae]MCT9818890.1 hypothetical protein [Microbacterium festucae]
MSTRTVRLIGEDGEVLTVARAAAAAITADRDLANRLLPAVRRLGQERRAFIAVREGEPAAAPRAASPAASSSDRVWGAVLTVALLAVVAAASMFLPPVRGVVVDIEVALPIVMIATPIAFVLLAVAALLARRASPYPAYVGMVMTTIVAVVLAALIGYRMVVGTASRGVPFTEDQLRLWFVAGGILLVELVVVAVLLARRKGGTVPVPGAVAAAGDRRRDDRALRAEAARLAAFRPGGPADAAALAERWESALAAADLPAATAAQARRLGPVAWLVWVYFDGDIDVSALGPR